MKRCLVCDALFVTVFADLQCPKCGADVVRVDGFYAYAPDLAHEGEGFQTSYFSELASLEAQNFWFRARNQLIVWALKKYCHDFDSFLEIGCGTGYVLSGIAEAFPEQKIYGSEIFTQGLGLAAARLPSAYFMQMDARNIPFAEEFDVIGAFDVLEHIKEDERVLSQVYAALKPAGYLVLTVPQHTWLWSAMDEYACHVLRYTVTDLHAKLETAGFHVVRSTSFVTTLLPAMMMSRFAKRNKTAECIDIKTELQISPWLNRLFFYLLSVEASLIKMGVNFPVGGSRLVIAKKI